MAGTIALVRMVLATDGSQGAEAALGLLLDLPFAAADEVVVLAIPPHNGVTIGGERLGLSLADIGERERELAGHIATRAADRLATHGVRARARVEDGPIARTIADVAVAEAADLVTVGSRGRGLVAGTLLGSTARTLARHSPVSVLVVRGRSTAPERVLAAVDGSADSDAALDLLGRLPLPATARVTLLHVTPEQEPPLLDRPLPADLRRLIEESEERHAAQTLERATRLLPGRAIAAALAERGHVARQVLTRAAAMGDDLIVLGSRGQTAGHGLFQGSVADAVLAEARCAVLVAKRRLAALPVRQAAATAVSAGAAGG